MQIIDGKKISHDLQTRIKSTIQGLGIKPNLTVVLVGNNPASQIYIRNKQKKATEVGINSSAILLPQDLPEAQLLQVITDLNNDSNVNGILVQLPLPKHISQPAVINAINPSKDVDCFHSINVGHLVTGNQNFVPCTPYGCLYLIKQVLGNNLSGSNALIIGRSNIVGKPMLHLLLQENCTVTIAHSYTQNIDEKCQQSDIIVAAAGQPHLVKCCKPGAIVIDVGINSVDGKLVGDVDFASVAKISGAITPVPGGVGPMTITFLLINTILATCKQQGINININDIIAE